MNDSSRPQTTGRVRPWVRALLVALGGPNVVAGLWAIASPRGWFRSFPGFDPRLVAAEPPFNAHLATDAGAGLFGSGLVLLLAAWLADTRSVRLGLVAFAAFSVPHAAYHVLNPSPGLTGAQDAQNAVLLVGVLVVTAVALIASGRLPDSAPKEPDRRRREVVAS